MSSAPSRRNPPTRDPLDLLLTFAGFFLVAFGPVSLAVSHVAPPDAVTTAVDVGASAAVAGAISLPYWLTGRSVGDVGAFFFWTAALALLVGLPAFLALGVLSAAPESGSTEGALLDAAFVGLVYGGAYLLVYGGGAERLRAG